MRQVRNIFGVVERSGSRVAFIRLLFVLGFSRKYALQDAQSSEIRKRDLELFDCRRACHVRLGGAGLSSLLYFGHFTEDGEENEEEEDGWRRARGARIIYKCPIDG